MSAVPPVRRKKTNKPQKITFEVDVPGELKPYRIVSGREILVFMKSKRAGKPEKPCCAYCQRAFVQAPERPLTVARLRELEARNKRTLEKSTAYMREAIEKLRRNDQLSRNEPKSDAEYLQDILSETLKATG
jgi:hypothetical protein